MRVLSRVAVAVIVLACFVAAGLQAARFGESAEALPLQNSSPAAAAANEWPQFRGNPELTGVTSQAPGPSLNVAWTYEAGESVESSAAIADGAVYVGSQAGELIALDLQSGKLRWKYKTKQGIGESSPAVANGIVYVGDLGGVVHAVNAADGKAVWTFPTKGEVKSSPVVVGDKVIIGSYDENLYALNARTGAMLWQVKTNGPVHATAGVMNGIAYISGCDENFRAIRISDGRELYVISSDAYTGASPALVAGAAYYGTFNNEVLRVDLGARKVAWRYTHPERQFPYYSSAAVVDGHVILGGRDKMVHSINTRTGKAAWTFTTRSRVESSPAVAAGRVYVGSNDGRFYVLDLKSGKKLWDFEAGAPLSASPAIAAGSVVIGSQDGRIYCFR